MNRKKLLVPAFAAAVLGALLGGSGAKSEPVVAERFSVDVNLRAVDSEQGTYECTAIVTSLESGELLLAPRIIFGPGETAETRSRSASGLEVQISVEVDPKSLQGSYTASIRSHGELVSQQSVWVSLAP